MKERRIFIERRKTWWAFGFVIDGAGFEMMFGYLTFLIYFKKITRRL